MVKKPDVVVPKIEVPSVRISARNQVKEDPPSIK
jgi:hypothetical protein